MRNRSIDFLIGALAALTPSTAGQDPKNIFHPTIPKTWDDAAMATLEVPLANPIGSPKHVSADYYYKIPVRPIYKSYPVYAPGREPAGYMERLKQQEPVILWDDAGHKPPLETEDDWIKAGERVFDSARFYERIANVSDVRDAGWYEKTGTPVAKDGTVPFARYVIRTKGVINLGTIGCAFCHTRVMPDGSVIQGAQGNFPFGKANAYRVRTGAAHSANAAQFLSATRSNFRALFGTPWITPDPLAHIDSMSTEELAVAFEGIPASVVARHRTSVFYPAQVPDLIGVKDRRYFDRTGLQQHRSPVDLMRYSALNQGGDDLANFNGLVPAGGRGPLDRPTGYKAASDQLPDPADPEKLGGRYSDEQLYALALYVYSLQPPLNPNSLDALAARGQRIFEREGCAGCHTPPLYTNNKLTLATGFTAPPGASSKYDILPVSVGTDPNLALKTRRGTGYYKIPSLKGLWYRSMFPHDGSCATLEDWFNPRRLKDGYVPTGFIGYGVQARAVPGHRFGLDLSPDDKKALLAFLRTL
jgi:hypothetical protein